MNWLTNVTNIIIHKIQIIEWILVPYGSVTQSHQSLVIDELVEFEEQLVEIQDLNENHRSF